MLVEQFKVQKKTQVYLISFIILVLTLAHYLTPPDKPLLHDIYRRLYYVPIILAAFTFGLKGALISSVTVSIVFIPHVFHRWGHIHLQTMDALFEILLYNIVAWVSGALVESERKQRARLKEAQEELIQANKFKVLGELASGMAHEIRNPLSAKHDFVFIEKPKPNKNQGFLKTQFHSKFPQIQADPSQLKQAFLNLLLNSLQALEKPGEISITSETSNGWINVEIKDTGPGISTENLPKVFTPFFTTKKEGVGLGLGIVERIVQNHKGKISVESQSGQGTVFTIKLPQKA